MNRQELLWLAGLLDAEGSFTVAHGGAPSPHGGKQLVVKVKMTDEDIIQSVKLLTNHTGKTTLAAGPKSQKLDGTNTKQGYELAFCGLKGKQLALSVAPYMSDRRRERVEYLTELSISPEWSKLTEEEQFMWCTGYVEGEGSINWRVNKCSDSYYGVRRFYIGTTDKDAMYRVGSILNLEAKFYHPTFNREKGYRPQWIVVTNKQSKVAEICGVFYPHMYNKKRGDIERVLAAPVGRLDEEERQEALGNYYDTQ